MSEKHTPGPWAWRGKSGSLHRVGDPPHTFGQTVLAPDYSYETGCDTVVSDADARLIAAAPELLAALRKIVDGPFPDDIDSPETQCHWTKGVAQCAIALVEDRS